MVYDNLGGGNYRITLKVYREFFNDFVDFTFKPVILVTDITV